MHARSHDGMAGVDVTRPPSVPRLRRLDEIVAQGDDRRYACNASDLIVCVDTGGSVRAVPGSACEKGRSMAQAIDHNRRRFVGGAGVAIAAAQLGLAGFASAQSSPADPAPLPAITPGAHTSFASLRQVDAGVLKIRLRGSRPRRTARRSSCCMAGPTTSTASSTSPRLLASGGLPGRSCPTCAATGPTRFRSSRDDAERPAGGPCHGHRRADGRARAPRSRSSAGSTGALEQPTSWPRSGRTAARGWSSVSGYLIGSQQAANTAPLSPKRGTRLVVPVLLCDRARPRLAMRRTGNDFARLIWQHGLAAGGTSTTTRSRAVRPQPSAIRTTSRS